MELKKLENYRKRLKANLSRHYNCHLSTKCNCEEIYGFCLTSKVLTAELKGIENCMKLLSKSK